MEIEQEVAILEAEIVTAAAAVAAAIAAQDLDAIKENLFQHNRMVTQLREMTGEPLLDFIQVYP